MKPGSVHLFAGIGGAALGFTRAGFEPVALCDINPWSRKVLAKSWPSAQLFDDVCTMKGEDIDRPFSVLTGGFPCQDISNANPNATGITGSRSRLWYEQLRIIDEKKPSYVVAENSSALRSRGLDALLRSLDEIGYDAEWHCIPACFLGASHKRDRIWIIAYPNMLGREGRSQEPILRQSALSAQSLRGPARWSDRSDIPSPRLSGGDDGVPERAHRLRGLGNSVYVPIAEMIGRAILEREAELCTVS